MASAEHIEADFVIVGTGAGGATAGRVLSAAGYSVVFLEEGRLLSAEERKKPLIQTMSQNLRDFGTQATTATTPMPLLQGRCVGGSTAINSGIIWRLPDDVQVDWSERFGLSELVDKKKIDEVFSTIERELMIEETNEAILGENSRLMRTAADALGLKGKPTHRNAARCQGSGNCLKGCATFARQSMDASYVPMSERQGAKLLTHAHVERVHIKNAKATHVSGRFTNTNKRFQAHAHKALIISGGAIQTPLLLQRSGIRGKVGNNFQAHPGSAVVGRFKERINMSFGATQGYEVPRRTLGYKLESLSMPAEMLAVRLPGAGHEWTSRLGDLDHYAQWCVQVRMKAVGSVKSIPLLGTPLVRYEPLLRDVVLLREALALLCKMMFTVGATEVYPGIAGIPPILKSIDEVRLVETASVSTRAYHMVGSHLFGTAPAGVNPRDAVLKPTLEMHDIRNLYVMDASALPTNLGVNPQHTIMGVTWRAADMLANRTTH